MRRQLWPLALVASGLFAACGSPAATTPPPATPVATSAAAAAEPTLPPLPTGDLYADLPQGRTPEGYQLLGAPDAPVTLVMYSDFL